MIVFQIAIGIIIGMAIFFEMRYTLHMFQLSSYQYKSYFRFMKTHLIQHLFPLLGIVCGGLFLGGLQLVSLVLAIPYICVLLSLTYPKEAKKKLVYTARVKRLNATTGILLLMILLVASAVLGASQILGILFICVSLTIYLVLLANLCNVPIENAVKQYYIKDAKRLLKACPDLKIIGITGSYGKTSVKYYLHTLLSAGFDVLMTPESYNTPMGVVKTIREGLRATHEIFLCEMGARHVGDIKEICDIVHPQIGIITSLGYQHLETFKSLDNVVSTKKELFDALPIQGPRYVNGDNSYVLQYGVNKGAISYGLEEDNEYRAVDLQYSEKGTSFRVIAPDGAEEVFTTELLGEHNVVNITGAIAIAHDLGIPLDKLKLPVRRLKGAPHRLQPIAKGNITIIDDAYNSNPNGAKMALKTLGRFEGVKVLVTPGMVELGAEEDRYNHEFGEDASKVCDYIVLVGKKQTQSIQKGVEESGFSKEHYYVAEHLQDALAYVYAIKTEQKLIVLLENDLPDNYL